MKLSTLAVIFIGTDKYLNFLPSWYESCEKNLVTDHKKHYFVFTDGEMKDLPENISAYMQEHQAWPFITLLRFNTILKAKEELKDYDWMLFIDADMQVVSEVHPTELFTDKKYIGVHHPCHYLQMPPHNQGTGAFETSPLSKAGIVDGDDTSVYYQGCVWGGKVPEVIEMMEELQKRTQEDLDNNVIAKWHDESQMNKFYAERPDEVNVLSPSFAFPEDFAQYCEFEPKIVHLSKDNSSYHQ
jgi:hypothetical protein